MQILQTHIFDHISLKAQQMAQQEMAQQQQPEQPQMMGIQQQPQMQQGQMEARVAEIQAQLMAEYLQQEAQITGSQQQDPLVDLKERELDLRQQDQAQKAQQEQMELAFDKQRAAEQIAVQRERIDSTEDIAQMRAEIARQRTANKGGSDGR
jgi:hypothetical protein